jgi:hypothetical protein
LNPDFPVLGIGATESREEDGTGSEDGGKRLHFFFLGNRLFGLRNAFFGGSITPNRLRFGNERANYPGPAVTKSALAEARRLGSLRG